MILIADSGSTKTDWRLINGETVTKLPQTKGMNPYHVSDAFIKAELELATALVDIDQISFLYFYGAGVSTQSIEDRLKSVFQSKLPKTIIEVKHDLLGAARAACGQSDGMVAILGTGSNSCLFKDGKVVENIPSLGYLLADEGAGVDIGRRFLEKYLRKSFNASTQHKIESTFCSSNESILRELYEVSLKNRYMAEFSKSVTTFIKEPEVEQIVLDSFISFFEKQIKHYKNYSNYKLHVIGSVGEVYKKQLEVVAEKYGVELGKLIKQPIDGLVAYHKLLNN